MKKYIIVFFASIISNFLYSQHKQQVKEEVIINVKNAISICFNENYCKDKVTKILNNHYMFKDLSENKKSKLIMSCVTGPDTDYEEFFCRMALSICGIENPNNCIAEKMK